MEANFFRGEWFHVVHVVVASTHRARGVGRALMNAMRERARAAGLERWMLNVKPDNVAAHALYERCGMRAAHESTSLRFSWADTDRLAPSPHVTTRVLESADDAAFESALSLSRGELEGFRTVLARTVIGAELEGRAVGVLAFDPSMPGAAPFRVRAPEYARALLEALRPIARARAEHDHVFTFIEGDPVLQAALEAAGARPVLRVLRMAGQISG